ncbi:MULTISPECIES: sensor histidine kinase [Nostocales]|uniref:Circadian input-output histidine kinase CikA n=3 Tax=Nostocales TaxID=1161 RepID=A0A0C1NDH5_9CYAN|nr:sensor histidine kinase [Tolypothrix bouteillei]KAF3886841.1 sensor histidine kinase [Tolypothrix bouteillei VB521301]
MNFSQLLDEKIESIVQNWVEAVCLDRQISSTDNLTHSAIRNHLPDVLKAMATVLSQSQDSDIESIVQNSLEHGVLRAAQGFTPPEIAREYRLLRQIIFSTLEADLVNGTVREVMRVHRAIDETIDEAIGQCFKSYVEERLQELQQLQSQAELTNQELTRLVKANQENLSQLAHELKNPLTSIIGYSELILRSSQKNIQPEGTLSHLEHIERVLRNGRQLLRLINDALEMSRYQAGKMQLHPVPTDVCSCIDDMVKMLEPLASAKDLQIIVDCNLAPVDRSNSDIPKTVVVDPLRLQQIVTNLLSNAIRYTESGSIKLRCSMLPDDRWCLSVSDTGVGIAPEDQMRIFDPFFRAESSVSHLVDGTGLGLAIVSQLVKLMQGKIELISQIGAGSTFSVILPVTLSLKTKE